MTVIEVITDMISENCDTDESALGPNTKLVSDIGMHSFDFFGVMSDLQDHYDIDIYDEDAQRLFKNDCTISQLADYIQTRVA